MVNEVFIELSSEMQKATDGLARELATIRSGRASPALVETILVDYHGAAVPIRQIANISIPEASLIVIQPWDRTSLRNIVKAILSANVGLNPSTDGNVVRIVISSLTEERRVELAKLVSKTVEERRVVLRNIRRDGIGKLRQMEKSKQISQDELTNAINKVDEISDSFIDKVNEIGQNKEREIREL
jgi:ribosome recycling factor